MGLDPGRLPHRRAPDGNVVRPLGGLHLRRVAGARGPGAGASANATNGASCCPAAKATSSSQVRVRDWYDGVERDTVVAAHGGVCRALIAHLGLAEPRPPRTAISGRAASTCSTARRHGRGTNRRARAGPHKAKRPDFRPAVSAKHHWGISRNLKAMRSLARSASVQIRTSSPPSSSSTSSSWPWS